MPKEPQPLPPTPRNETPEERADRNMVELLQELRVLQTGVQILFAFLLGVAFTSRFPQLTAFQRDTYVVTLLLTVITSAVLATPVALHRGLFQRGVKPRIVALSSLYAEVGLAFLALALNGAVLLLMDLVLGRIAAITITTATTVMFAGLWFLVPWPYDVCDQFAARIAGGVAKAKASAWFRAKRFSKVSRACRVALRTGADASGGYWGNSIPRTECRRERVRVDARSTATRAAAQPQRRCHAAAQRRAQGTSGRSKGRARPRYGQGQQGRGRGRRGAR
ncbi:DUF6328 family protein [Streptomyces herbicida]|uniref:DUF6328 family protein n=1 Tax=Streptomyces herbicida TaxID=3065675 RepID=UPI002930FF2C|nr:DUF6328 family protein [Streptomyces sp. NEAU-HV9]